jgi:hypothetical protein
VLSPQRASTAAALSKSFSHGMEGGWGAIRFAVEVLSREGGIVEICRDGRYWAVYDAEGTLVCLTVYKKGAAEVLRRLTALQALANGPGEASPYEGGRTMEPVPSPQVPQAKTPRAGRRPRKEPSARRSTPGGAGDSVGHLRRLGTLTIRVEVLMHGEEHTD